MEGKIKELKLEGIVIRPPVYSDSLGLRIRMKINSIDGDQNSLLYRYFSDNDIREIEIYHKKSLPIFKGDNLRTFSGAVISRADVLEPQMIEKLDDKLDIIAVYHRSTDK